MRRIVGPDLVRLVARVGARRMGDAGLPVALARASAGVVERSGTGSGGNGRARGSLEAAGAVTLHAYNTARDRDDAGVLGAPRRPRAPREADEFRPLLHHAEGQAWLRIAKATTADALAGAGRGRAVARATANRTARLLSYRRHGADVACAEAIRLDLRRFANARRIADVCALGVGDACAVQGEGRASASVGVAWDALLSAVVPDLAASVGAPDAGAFLVEVPAGAEATLRLSISDRFTVAFARVRARGERPFRVVVRRQRADDHRLAATVGIEAGFADPAAAARILQGTLAAVLNAPATALAAIRKATSLARVPARHRPVVAALAERFGIADARPLAALRERLAELDARLARRVDEVLRTRLAVALDAEYRRLASDALLLEVELSEAALRRLHPSLLALDTAAVFADPGVGRDARTLLHDRKVERWQSFGIGASFGSWFEFESGQAREDRVVTRRRIDADGDRTQREFLGATRYRARANGWRTDYGATFEAVDAGTGDGTRCALALWWEEARMRADAAGVDRIVDDAVLWGVVDAAGADALRRRLAASLAGIGRCRPRFDVAIERDAAHALAAIARARPHAWARHAARALPRNARTPARLDAAAREAAYAPVLAALADTGGTALRNGIGALLRPRDPRLATQERQGDTPWTCVQVLRQAGMATRGPGAAWRRWAEGAARLDGMLGRSARGGPLDPAEWQALADAFAVLRPAFEQPFALRTVASLLASALAGRPGATTRLTLAYERDGEPRTLVVAGAGSAHG